MQNSRNLYCYFCMLSFCWHRLFLHSHHWWIFELEFLEIKCEKSACLRFVPRYRNMCCEVVVSGHSIKWVESARYIGVYLVYSTNFKCLFSNKKAFSKFQ